VVLVVKVKMDQGDGRIAVHVVKVAEMKQDPLYPDNVVLVRPEGITETVAPKAVMVEWSLPKSTIIGWSRLDVSQKAAETPQA
jgi:hypothetical protein